MIILIAIVLTFYIIGTILEIAMGEIWRNRILGYKKGYIHHYPHNSGWKFEETPAFRLGMTRTVVYLLTPLWPLSLVWFGASKAIEFHREDKKLMEDKELHKLLESDELSERIDRICK